MNKEKVVDDLLELLASEVNGTPDFTSDDEGIRVSADFEVALNGNDGILNGTLTNAVELSKQFPSGFHIVRVHGVQHQRIKDKQRAACHTVYMELEVLFKRHNEKSAAEQKEEQELENRLRAEKELEEESLQLDSLENGIVDLIRASDNTIKPYAEMTDAKKKVIRSHLNTLQALMRL